MLKPLIKMEEMYKNRAQEIAQEKERGGKMVAYGCSYTPAEIIYASGAIPFRLLEGGEQEPCILGEEYTQNIYCPFVKSFVGFRIEGKNPFYQMPDMIWMTHGCDMKKNIPEVWYRFFNTPTYVINLPRTFYRDSSLQLFLGDLKQAGKKLERLTNITITDEALLHAISVYNETRRLLKRLYETRTAKNPPITGKDAINASQLSFMLDPEAYNRVLKELVEELEEMVKAGKGVYEDNPLRIMLSGSICAHGDTKLIDLIEQDRTKAIVTDDFCTGARNFHDLVVEDGSPLEAIARRYLTRVPCSRMRPNTKRFDFVKEMIKKFRVEGLIYYTLKFCFNYRTDAVRMREEIKKEGVYVLHVESDYSGADIGQLSTRVAAFFEILEESR